MAGDIGGVARKIDAGLGFEHPHDRERNRHQRRLGILGEDERLGRTVPDRLAEPLAESGVDLLKHLARGSKGIGQRLAHADGLASLSGENECNCHCLAP